MLVFYWIFSKKESRIGTCIMCYLTKSGLCVNLLRLLYQNATEWHKPQRFICSEFWNLEVQGQSVRRLVFSEDSVPQGHLFPESSHGLFSTLRWLVFLCTAKCLPAKRPDENRLHDLQVQLQSEVITQIFEGLHICLDDNESAVFLRQCEIVILISRHGSWEQW